MTKATVFFINNHPAATYDITDANIVDGVYYLEVKGGRIIGIPLTSILLIELWEEKLDHTNSD